MVVVGSTYYHARVLHHYSWRAADSTVYKSSKLTITTAAPSLGGMLHTVYMQQPWGCDERNPQLQTAAAATYRTSRSSSSTQWK